jgi:hypothetical protein
LQIDKYDLIAAARKQLADKGAADVAGAELHEGRHMLGTTLLHLGLVYPSLL